MSNAASSRTLFAGIGSPHGDDRIGWLVAESLRATSGVSFQLADAADRKLEAYATDNTPPHLDIRQATTPSDLLDWLEGYDRLIVCDACATQPGTTPAAPAVHRWQWPTQEVATLRSASSHAFGLPQVLQLADRLGTLPPETIVFGIEGSCFDAFAELSPHLAAAQDAIIQRIAVELARVCPAPEAASHA